MQKLIYGSSRQEDFEDFFTIINKSPPAITSHIIFVMCDVMAKVGIFPPVLI